MKNFPELFSADILQPDLSYAVVGNSPNLRGAGDGELIDSFDVVCRMNRFETARYIPDTGMRTDLYVTNLLFDFTPFMPPDVKAVVVSRPMARQYAQNVGLASMMRHAGNLPADKSYGLPSEDYAILLDLLGIANTENRGVNPTTGLVTLYLLLRYAKPSQIGLFGFDFFQSIVGGGPAHYFSHDVGDGVSPEAQLFYSPPEGERRAVRHLVSNAPCEIYAAPRTAEQLQEVGS